MPIWEYQCKKCGRIEEVICSHKDRPKSIPCKFHWFETECEIDMGILYEEVMYPIVSAGNFIVNGFNEKNGYAGDK